MIGDAGGLISMGWKQRMKTKGFKYIKSGMFTFFLTQILFI